MADLVAKSNYAQYMDEFKRIVEKHAGKVGKYYENIQQPGKTKIYFLIEERNPFSGAFGKGIDCFVRRRDGALIKRTSAAGVAVFPSAKVSPPSAEVPFVSPPVGVLFAIFNVWNAVFAEFTTICCPLDDNPADIPPIPIGRRIGCIPVLSRPIFSNN